MKKIIADVVSHIVTDPEAIQVTETMENDQHIFEVKVAPADVGKVIGRNGMVANAIRTLVKVIAMHRGLRANVNIWSPNRNEKGGK